jgi:tetratricopeptide (TPR) repeat protein
MMGMGGGMMGMMGMGGGMGMMGMGGGMMMGGAFSGGFNGGLGMVGAINAQSLISMIKAVVGGPQEWFQQQQPMPLAPMLFPGLGMVGMVGGQNMLGMVGAGPPPLPAAEGGNGDPAVSNTIDFFQPSLALIVRAPSRMHTTITGGIIGGKVKRAEGAMLLERNRIDLAAAKNPKLNVLGNQGGADQVAKVQPKVPAPVNVANVKVPPKADLDPAKVWQEVLAKEAVEPGLAIATADFLFEAGKFDHAAEFLKATLRQGVVVRPWVYEALAVALEASGGDRDEIRRARLSAVALDPKDAQGFLQAARTMADGKQWERALAFCRQAALLEPNMPQVYEEALEMAELGKDAKAMEWAASKLVSQDWPADNIVLHKKAQLRLDALAGVLKRESRGNEADRLKEALRQSNRRDLVVTLSWDIGSEPAEVELLVKEPSGSVCSTEQMQTPGGGTMVSTGLLDQKPSASYTAPEAFAGDYEVTVRRLWGQPLGGRARLEITQNKGTPQETKRLEIVRLDQANSFKVYLRDGRRTELASVPPPGSQQARRQAQRPESKTGSAMSKLRDLASGDFSGAKGISGGAFTPGASMATGPELPRRPQPEVTLYQTGVAPLSGAGMDLSAQFKVSADRREVNLVMQPVFQSVGTGRPPVNLSVIPGGLQP